MLDKVICINSYFNSEYLKIKHAVKFVRSLPLSQEKMVIFSICDIYIDYDAHSTAVYNRAFAAYHISNVFGFSL